MKKTPLRRRKPLANAGGVVRRKSGRVWTRADDDKVTPGLRQLVLARDGRCMAPVLDKTLQSQCADNWGRPVLVGSYFALHDVLELDHVPDATAMGKRAPSDQYHLVVLCPFHHRLSGWATSHHGRELEREYLRSLRPVDNPSPQHTMEPR